MSLVTCPEFYILHVQAELKKDLTLQPSRNQNQRRLNMQSTKHKVRSLKILTDVIEKKQKNMLSEDGWLRTGWVVESLFSQNLKVKMTMILRTVNSKLCCGQQTQIFKYPIITCCQCLNAWSNKNTITFEKYKIRNYFCVCTYESFKTNAITVSNQKMFTFISSELLF